VFSHRVLLALINKGRPREDAYRIVQDPATSAVEGRGNFRDLLISSGALNHAEVDSCFDLNPYLRHVDLILERAGVPGTGAREAPAATGARRHRAPR
jgi:adenylosuccinate lyase